MTLYIVGSASALGSEKTPESWSHVHTWMFEAESEGVPANGAKGARVGYLVRRVVAASPDNLYFFCGHEEESIGSHWDNEPYNVEITLNGTKLIRYRKFIRQAEFVDLPTGTDIPGPMANDVLFLFAPVWPLTNYPPPVDKDIGMIKVVQAALNSGTYQLTSQREVVDGESCVIMRSKSEKDLIWLSENKQFCVLQREWSNPETGKLMGRIHATRIAEVVPNLWMPIEIECTTFSSSSGSQSIPRARTITRVTKWAFNADVPARLFSAELKPGSIEYLSPGTFRQLSPGGKEHLDEVANFYRGPIRLPHRPAFTGTFIRSFALATIGGVGGASIALVFGRLRYLGISRYRRRNVF